MLMIYSPSLSTRKNAIWQLCVCVCSSKFSASSETNIHFVGKSIICGEVHVSPTHTTSFFQLCFSLSLVSLLHSPHALVCTTSTLQKASIYNKFSHPFFYSLHKLCALLSRKAITVRRSMHAGLIHTICSPRSPGHQMSSLYLAHPTTQKSSSLILESIKLTFMFNATAACFMHEAATLHVLAPPQLLLQSTRHRAIRLCSDCLLTHLPSISDSSSTLHLALSLNSRAHSPLGALAFLFSPSSCRLGQV
eukprot:Phypoly_transcript_02104.p1 GENE.Phypoly_transcript_02104~~Phypoly_transcript_02104.p1  ORF type:complete len:249 (+),score=22.57 Phypoly_transcript_02104:961-1707(+)